MTLYENITGKAQELVASMSEEVCVPSGQHAGSVIVEFVSTLSMIGS